MEKENGKISGKKNLYMDKNRIPAAENDFKTAFPEEKGAEK